MPSLFRHRDSSSSLLVVAFDKRIHQFSTPKMKISKAPELLNKAVTAFKIRAEVLRTKLLILASLRRRTALVRAVSRGIHSLVVSSPGSGGRPEKKRATVEYGHGDGALLVLREAVAASRQPAATFHRERDGNGVVDLSEQVAVLDEDGHRFSYWTRSLFEDDNCYDDDDEEEEDVHHDRDDHGGVLDGDDEPSVIDIIRSNREVEGLEFNMDEEIDQACDMFIRRFRERMNSSF